MAANAGGVNAASASSIAVEILGEDVVDKITKYTLKVTGPGNTCHTVQRRYAEFEDLYMSTLRYKAPELEMPPKSTFFRKNFSRSFQQDRRQKLAAIANVAAAEASSGSCSPVIREFLGLKPVADTQAVQCLSPFWPAAADSSEKDCPPELPDAPSPSQGVSASRNCTSAFEFASCLFRTKKPESAPDPEVSWMGGTSSLPEPPAVVQSRPRELQVSAQSTPQTQLAPKSTPSPVVGILARYLVDNSLLMAETCGLAYRNRKSLDVDARVESGEKLFAQWGEVVHGKDEGDGWIMITGFSGGMFLPTMVDNKAVLLRKFYRVDNSKLQANTAGLAYRYQKSLDKKESLFEWNVARWNTHVAGVLEDGMWLRVGSSKESRYLPMSIDGKPVLEEVR